MRWFLAFALAVSAWSVGAQSVQCRAIDGDTLRCGKERVRLRQVYAAEMGEAGGPEAKARLQQRLETGDLRIERRARDRYGRTVADVYAGGRKIQQGDIGPRSGRGVRGR